MSCMPIKSDDDGNSSSSWLCVSYQKYRGILFPQQLIFCFQLFRPMGIDLFLYENVGMIRKGEGIVFPGKKDAVGFVLGCFLAFSFVEFRKGFSVYVCVEGDRWTVEGIDIDRNIRRLICF